ncbi:hypothetical protein [Shewanella benthica]|uniref:hypothetical protein n=1 Tax=Shewanella benthica TaxID=43661 RepID=UPI0002EB10FF|nr:hypothetical protein [Shewanella benthica]
MKEIEQKAIEDKVIEEKVLFDVEIESDFIRVRISDWIKSALAAYLIEYHIVT